MKGLETCAEQFLMFFSGGNTGKNQKKRQTAKAVCLFRKLNFIL